MTEKEKIMKILREEGLNVTDHDHVLTLKAKNQEEADLFVSRIQELGYQQSYGYSVPSTETDTSESELESKPEYDTDTIEED